MQIFPIIRFFLFLPLVAIALCSEAMPLHAQTRITPGSRMAEERMGAMNEIHRIDFVGNSYFTDEVLEGVITTRASEKSIARRLVQYYRRQFSRNTVGRSALSMYISQMRLIENDLGDVREYFNREQVAVDTTRIKAYYNEHGFHQAMVSAKFSFQQETRENVLTFMIIENPPARLQQLVYRGLDSLPSEVALLVKQTKTVQTGNLFNQAIIAAQNDRILQILRNQGYFYARYKDPLVLYFAEQNTDSVTVFFSTGLRQRIGTIFFVDSLNGQPAVSYNMRRQQIEFREGDWYSQDAINQSINNLYSLGVFEAASIDTSSERQPHTDTSLHFRVFTRMRKMQEIGVNILTNKNKSDDFWNAGPEVTYTNKNIFYAAQTLDLYGRILLQDINGWIDKGLSLKELQFEYQGGGRFSQPFVDNVYNMRMGFSAQGQYSLRTIYAPLQLQSWTARASFPFTLRPGSIINSWVFDIAGANERPFNFGEAYERALSQPGVDSLLVKRQLYQYAQLDTIVNIRGNFLSSLIIGASIVHDSRNHPFTPNQGYFGSLSAEWGGPGGLGGARFARIATTALGFWPLTRKDVLAAKLRIGHTFWFDRNESYVPLERHFFAGGSNSVRAFGSRDLRAVPIDAATTSDEVRNLADFIGSGSLIEGSVEFRYKFREYPLSSSFWEQQIASLGITSFVDFGNTFNSFLENPDNYEIMPINIALQKLAIGFGAGVRYDTPVGPIRLDFATPVYNPMVSTDQWIWQRPFSMRFQFGIGHAF